MRKKTGLWLKGLPCLVPSNKVQPLQRIEFRSGKSFPPSMHYNREFRDKTFQGIANAMAEQWG